MSNSGIAIPAPIGKKYLAYQEKGIRYALGGRGTLIADEMGLGKTVQAIGVINATPGHISVLIVAPAGLLFNWKNELEAWLVPGIRDIHVVSYHGAKTFAQSGFKADILIVDEAHYIKHADTQRSQLIDALAKNAKRVLLLTGTPMENCPIESWPLLRIACPEKWDPYVRRPKAMLTLEQRKSHPGEGENFWEFASRYCDLKKVTFKRGRRFVSSFDFSGASHLEELNRRMRETCMVRRLKKDVLTELPEKRRQLILLESKVKGDSLLPGLSEVNYDTVIKQLWADKVLFEEWSKRRKQEALDKLDDCLKLIIDAFDEQSKIVIFAHHQDVIDKLELGLIASGYEGVKVTGKTHVADRGACVKRFQTDKDCRFFIGSIGAAGVGLTLTAASHVIFVELDPVPGRMTQAEDRVHRIGQNNNVLIWHLLANGSLCARIAKILVKKQAVLNVALDSPDTMASIETFRDVGLADEF